MKKKNCIFWMFLFGLSIVFWGCSTTPQQPLPLDKALITEPVY
jgi:hypothetical protein